MKLRSFISVVALASFVAGCQSVLINLPNGLIDSPPVQRGSTMPVKFIANGCSLNGGDNVPSVVIAPAHGSITFAREIDFPQFNSKNPLSYCNDRQVAGMRVYFHADTDYSGRDHFMVKWGSTVHGFVDIQ